MPIFDVSIKTNKNKTIMKNTILFSNQFCTIVETPKGLWIREDEILHTAMEVDCYFNESGILIRK